MPWLYSVIEMKPNVGTENRRLNAAPTMSRSDAEIPVFIDTNLGTRIALPILPDITVKELKRKLEKAHLSCFPEVGKIRVNWLTVKRKSCHYHLSESLPLKYAFQGSTGAWFLQIEVRKKAISNQTDSSRRNGSKIYNHNSAGNGATASLELKSSVCSHETRIECKRKTSKTLECSANPPSDTLSESISVSGIIKKYFSNYDEVTSSSGRSFTAVSSIRKEKDKPKTIKDLKYVKSQPDSPWPDDIGPKASRSKCKKPEVGKRVLMASVNLGLSPSNQMPALSLCKSDDRKSMVRKPASTVRSLVFDIPDDGD